jgi:hypothetical protein
MIHISTQRTAILSSCYLGKGASRCQLCHLNLSSLNLKTLLKSENPGKFEENFLKLRLMLQEKDITV